jgi:two-component sensor histidine kinase
MIIIVIVLILSSVFQFSAAICALRLIKVTNKKFSWILISISLFLMGIRRLIPLFSILSASGYTANLANEAIGLVLSLLMLIGVMGIRPIFVERKIKEEKIKSLLSEKEVLLREIYHRTKNTLQTIRALIMLQASEYSTNLDIRKLATDINGRIQAIAIVHEKLYKSQDLSHISINDYINELTVFILQGYTIKNISLNVKIDDQFFLLDTAIPFGLILNELMTNSLKYAFPDDRNGAIDIYLVRLNDGNNIFYYSDNGVGVPDSFNFRNNNSLGLKLIHSIGEQQIEGNVTMMNNHGIKCLIEFRNNFDKIRV